MDHRFYTSPGQAWDAMLEDCRNARESIEMEQYILCNDRIGRAFMDVFLQKQREGVSVRLLLDRIGSRLVYDSDLIRALADAGAQIRFYNPIHIMHLFRPWRWFPRNHAKTLLIDSKIAYIGGVCLDDDMKDWRDTHMRFTGPMVDEIEKNFSLERINWRKRIRDMRKEPVETGTPFEYVVHKPHVNLKPIYRRLVRSIKNAEHSVRLVTPYLLAPRGLWRALRKASARGVRIEIMTNKASDIRLADWVSHSYFPSLLRRGIRIYLYEPSILHAKYAIIDGKWATIGSTNFDYLSLTRNREANIVTQDPDAIAQLDGHFTKDIESCLVVDKSFWTSRPLLVRIVGRLARMIRTFL